MNIDYRFKRRRHGRAAAVLAALLLLLNPLRAQTAAIRPASLSAAEQALVERITTRALRERTAALAAPEMEGRGTLQPGGERAAVWIADRFRELGLRSLGDKGTYFQQIEFRETVPTAATAFTVGDARLAFGSEFSLLPMNNGRRDIAAEMVFVGYGIQHKASGRNDLKDIDIAGRIVVVLAGHPPNISTKDWETSNAPFVYRRNLIERGAAAIVYVDNGTEAGSTADPIEYFSRRQIERPGERGFPSGYPPYVYVAASAAEKLFAKSGATYAEALAQAAAPTFKPFRLDQKGRIVAEYRTTRGTSPNVVGYLEGRDPALRSEAVVFTAHYDAYGREGGRIYYGAADNALGTAEMLAVAETFARADERPRRSLVFLAVTGEEYGLYGSRYWAKNPTWNIKKVAANLNLDGIGTEVYGPVRTIVGYGAEHSSLGAVLADVAAAMGLAVAPDPAPDEKVFYRSDHYSFVERGVPALMVRGLPEGEIRTTLARVREWEKTDYHRPGDVIRPEWSWEGAKTVADLVAVIGWRTANADAMPIWNAGSSFAERERGSTK